MEAVRGLELGMDMETVTRVRRPLANLWLRGSVRVRSVIDSL